MRWAILALTLSLATAALVPSSKIRAAEVTSEQAVRSAVQTFLDAVRSQNSDAVMKTVDVPWFHMGEEIIKERDQLKSEFDVLFRRRTFSDLRYEIVRIAPYEMIRDRTSAEERRLLDAAISPKDHVVLISMDTQVNKNRKIVLLVRVAGETAKVVGLKE